MKYIPLCKIFLIYPFDIILVSSIYSACTVCQGSTLYFQPSTILSYFSMFVLLYKTYLSFTRTCYAVILYLSILQPGFLSKNPSFLNIYWSYCYPDVELTHVLNLATWLVTSDHRYLLFYIRLFLKSFPSVYHIL